MTCLEIQELLSAVIDGVATPEEVSSVEGHLGKCATCNAEMEALKHTIQEVRDLSGIPAPPGLKASILEAIASESQDAYPEDYAPQQTARITWLWPSLSAAAVLLVAISLGIMQFQQPENPFSESSSVARLLKSESKDSIANSPEPMSRSAERAVADEFQRARELNKGFAMDANAFKAGDVTALPETVPSPPMVAGGMAQGGSDRPANDRIEPGGATAKLAPSKPLASKAHGRLEGQSTLQEGYREIHATLLAFAVRPPSTLMGKFEEEEVADADDEKSEAGPGLGGPQSEGLRRRNKKSPQKQNAQGKQKRRVDLADSTKPTEIESAPGSTVLFVDIPRSQLDQALLALGKLETVTVDEFQDQRWGRGKYLGALERESRQKESSGKAGARSTARDKVMKKKESAQRVFVARLRTGAERHWFRQQAKKQDEVRNMRSAGRKALAKNPLASVPKGEKLKEKTKRSEEESAPLDVVRLYIVLRETAVESALEADQPAAEKAAKKARMSDEESTK